MRRGSFGSGSTLRRSLANLHVDAAVERLEAPRAKGVQQRVPAQDPARPGGEHAKERRLAARERDRLAGFAGERAGVEIEDKAREPQRRFRLVRRRDAFGADGRIRTWRSDQECLSRRIPDKQTLEK